jgi:hypothetical protein
LILEFVGFENGEITNIPIAGTQFQNYDLKPGTPKSKIFQHFGSAFQNFKFGVTLLPVNVQGNCSDCSA